MEIKIDGKTLEQRLAEIDSKLLTIEDYVEAFGKRYSEEDTFKARVHKSLNLGRFKKIGLGFNRRFREERYQTQVDELITNYANLMHERTINALELKKGVVRTTYAKKKAELGNERIENTNTEITQLENKVNENETQILTELANVTNQINEEVSSVTEEFNQELTEIEDKTDAEKFVKTELKKQLANSELLEVNKETGELDFNENAITSKLEDLFLKELLDGMENNSGRMYMNKLIQQYNGVISHWAEMEDISELTNVDWVQSAYYSASMGYRRPQYPFLITGKSGETQAAGRTSVDAALSIDGSGSMVDNNRWQVARQLGIALNSVMRQMNPENNLFRSVYYSNYDGMFLKEIETRDLLAMRQTPSGGTPTHKALEWFIEKLADSPVALAYLLTDGEPSYIDDAYRVADEISRYDNILLRIFHIDPEPYSEGIVREMGQRAGPQTKVIPVKYDQMGADVLNEISNSIGDMVDIGRY